MFDANMAVGISTWLGATTVTTSGQAISSTTTGTDTMGEFAAIQTRLIDMQTKLDALIAWSTITPVVTPDTTVVAPSKVTGTGN